ncbi:major facilitator superfamily domain-containing protein [Xylariomycetidae sp. FL2044]|nr:major facilitator superfamily domain-containing protein [Xylariomycetidae sp. FL2044]
MSQRPASYSPPAGTGDDPPDAKPSPAEQRPAQIQIPQPAARGWRFWAVFPPLSIATFLVGLDSTITSSALPFITSQLKAGDNYVWIVNGYLLTSTSFLPLWGQLSQVLGRRWPTMAAVAIFILGSGVSGGATSTAMLIAGRLVQGLGGAGITAMTQLIVTDLVSLRERGKYIGVIYAVFGLGTAVGPPIGGVIAQYSNWNWVFWINLPIGGVTLLMQFFFLQIVFAKQMSVSQKLRQIDWFGNALLVASVVSILIALSWANTRYTWGSYHIIVPLILGFVGMGLFFLFESSKFCAYPTIPPRLFGNRTSTIGLVCTFLQSMLTMWRVYFLPVYFQAVTLASVSRSGVLLLPTILIGIPAAIVSGQILARLGKYKAIHIFGFTVATLASGLYIDFDSHSSLAKIVIYQIIAGIGGGCLLTTMLPSVQAANPPKDVAAATSSWAFFRALGNVWGIAIPAAIFNNQMDSRIRSISSLQVRDFLSGGDAYTRVSADFILSLPQNLQSEVRGAYQGALKVVWEACLAFNAVGFLLIFLEKEIKLRTMLTSDHKLKEKTKKPDEETTASVPQVDSAK